MEQEILKDWQKKAIEFIASAKEVEYFFVNLNPLNSPTRQINNKFNAANL